MKFWMSFWLPNSVAFEYKGPWWVSGHRFPRGLDNDYSEDSICAAVKAESERAAKELLLAGIEQPHQDVEWRFIEEKPADWSPYSGRFQKSEGVEW